MLAGHPEWASGLLLPEESDPRDGIVPRPRQASPRQSDGRHPAQRFSSFDGSDELAVTAHVDVERLAPMQVQCYLVAAAEQ